MINFGEVPAGAVLPIPFASYNSSGASITLTGLAVTDIEVYKGTGVVQRSSDAGYALIDTDGIDIDGITGIHGFTIDTGDNTDAGFYSVGDYFRVIVSAVTVDAQTINFIAATFRLKAAEVVAGKTKVDVDAFGGAAGTFASGRPEVNASHAAGTAWNSGAIGAATLASDTITAAKIAAGAFTAAKFAAGAFDAVWTVAARLLTAGTNIVLAKGTGVTGFNDLSAAQVNAEVDTALADYDAPTSAELVSEINSVQADIAALPTAGENAAAVWEETLTDHSGTVGSTAEALAAAGSAGDPWATQLPGAYGAGSAGKIVGDNIDVTVSSRSSQTSVDTVDSNVDAILVDTGTTLQAELDGIQADTEDIQTRLPAALVSGRIDASVGAMAANVITATAIATGAITAAKFAANALDAVWSTATRLLTAGTNIVLAKGTGVTGFNDLDAAGVRGAVGLASANIDTQLGDLPTNAELTTALGTADDATLAAIAALNNLSAAEVNAEVVDALATDTYAEPGQGAPAATISLAAKINYMYKSFRNKKTQSASEWKLFADDAVTVDQKSTVSDDGTTATRGEIAAGP